MYRVLSSSSALFSRTLSRGSSSGKCCRLHSLALDHRRLIRVRGDEAGNFLQGLITNDMHHLQDGGASSMYAMVLNSQGRVLHDVLIYNNDNEEKVQEYLIEADGAVIENLMRHLKMYRLRKKIDIDLCSDKKCWVLFDPDISFESISKVDIECLYVNPKVDSRRELNLEKNLDGAIITRDPRMKLLGHKLILGHELEPSSLIPNLTASDVECYTNLRYRMGVSEGPAELPPGNVMPLEANVDFLHGVSFHKGCYVGQELTARVFHTGVVRKRYMPVAFTERVESSSIPAETNITNSKGKTVGRMRCCNDHHGIALLRVADCLADPQGLSVMQHSLTTFKPSWWPIEASKDKEVV